MHAAGTLLSSLANGRGNDSALVLFDGERELLNWSFERLWQEIQACMQLFADTGLRPGQQVLCICADCPHFFALLHASLLSGLVFVPLHPDQDQGAVPGALDHPQHALILIENSLLRQWTARLHGPVLTFDISREEWLPGTPAVDASRASTQRNVDQCHDALPGNTAALLFHSSGSSGKPKVMRYSASELDTFLYWQQYLFAAFPDAETGPSEGPPSARLNVLPLAHWGGLSFCLQAHLERRAVWLFTRFSSSALLQAAEQSGCQLLMLVPAMYRELLPLLQQQTHPPALRYCLTMGEAMPPALREALQAVDTLQLCTAYGMSEALSGLAHGLVPWHQVPADSCGRHCFGELQLVDEQGRIAPAADAAEGELWVRNATVLPRYTDPALCSEKYVDGWYRSGDWFYRDAAGNYFFRARMDGMCVHNGRNVYPWQIENVLINYPGVVACLACPVQTRTGSRRLAALVVATPSLLLKPADLLDYFLQHGALYAAPIHVLVRSALPLTHSGKPDRHAAGRLLQAAHDIAAGQA